MSRFPRTRVPAFLLCVVLAAGPSVAAEYGLGRVATPAEIAAWDIDVRPDGQGLPVGKGDVATGEELFQEKCGSCHGEFGEGVDRWPVLAGGADTLKSDDPVKTIGSYWPYLSTVFDYINRSMPFGDAQSLSADETYAIVAYLLNLNDIVEDDFVLSKQNFTSIAMPNVNGFTEDARPDVKTGAEPCMKNCKTEVRITRRARILNVTPDSEKNPSAAMD